MATMKKALKTRWTHIAGSVYENQNKTRVHLLGMVYVKNSVQIGTSDPKLYREFLKLMRVYAGNKKRAMMAFAEMVESLLESGLQSTPLVSRGWE